MNDSFGRSIDYLRISVTDRCNLRCRYCMPDGIRQVPMSKILTYENIRELCEAAAELGITKIKLTGGEPLARLGCPDLVGMLREIPGIRQITMTSNGVLLKDAMQDLVRNGLDAVNISLDTLKPERFLFITGFDRHKDVLEGIEAALGAGLRVKINCVLQPGVNEDEWPDLMLLAKDRALDVRFIEMMPIGQGKHFRAVSNEEIRKELARRYPEIKEDTSVHGNGPARYVKLPGFMGSIGFISAIHGVFCSDCNRLRVTSTGRLKPCLCYGDSVDLMPAFRESSEEKRLRALKDCFIEAVRIKPKSHSFRGSVNEDGRNSKDRPEEDVPMTMESAQMVEIGG